MDIPTLLIKFFSELVGTFIFIILILLITNKNTDAVNVAIPIGLALAIAIVIFGDVSGGHFNPAVSFTMFIRDPKVFTGIMFLIYITAQAIGAFTALEINNYIIKSNYFKKNQ
jgi:glycerol uptake facilitator-like aquaporin